MFTWGVDVRRKIYYFYFHEDYLSLGLEKNTA